MPKPRPPALLLLTAGLGLLIALFVLYRTVVVLTVPSGSLLSPKRLSIPGLLRVLAYGGFCGFTSWSLFARRLYGPWCGALLLLSVVGVQASSRGGQMLHAVLINGPSAYRELPPPYLPYGSQVQVAAAAVTQVVLYLVLLVAAGYLVLSPRIRSYVHTVHASSDSGA